MKKLIIPTDGLKPALKMLALAIPKKPVLPVTSNLYIRARKGEAELISTDLELTISYTCSCECNQEFEMLLPFDFLSRLTPLLGSQPLGIELQGKKAQITAEGKIFHLAGLEDVVNFPKIPDIPKKNSLQLTAAFMTSLHRSMVTASKDDLRPAMTKACLEFAKGGITVVSTDAHLFYKHFFPMEVPTVESVLISPKIGMVLDGLDKATIFWHSHHVAFRSDNITVISTRHSDKYPDWRVVIPNTKPNLKVNRLDLIMAVNTAMITDTERLRFEFDTAPEGSRQFKIVSTNEDFERDSSVTMAGEYSGTTDHVALHPVFLKTILHQIDFDDISMHIDSPARGVVITSEENENYLGLIMPLHNQ